MKRLIFKKWYDEYKNDLIFLFKQLICVLKGKNMIYKKHSFESFCELIYSKSSQYG